MIAKREVSVARESRSALASRSPEERMRTKITPVLQVRPLTISDTCANYYKDQQYRTRNSR